MAPDRGQSSAGDVASDSQSWNGDSQTRQTVVESSDHDSENEASENEDEDEDTTALLQSTLSRQRSDAACFHPSPTTAMSGQNFTLRGVLVGLAIGVIICFSNTYFGLQTGWVSGMVMPASLIGFGFFKSISAHLSLPFSPVENVLVQTVAGAVGTMPLGCGFVGVMPALEFLLKRDEGGPLHLDMWRLVVWSLGVCLFGVVFAVPLRKEVIIRERLKFPSGTATALMIGVLHGNSEEVKEDVARDREQEGLLEGTGQDSASRSRQDPGDTVNGDVTATDSRDDWKAKIRLLVIAFSISAFYTLLSYFVPQLRDLPIFGLPFANTWLWTLNPSPAYIGQGIIMGPATTLHMLLGAIVGWGILSPLAKSKGWAPGPVSDWDQGSKGWIVWVSLATMLADSLINLGWLVLKPTIWLAPQYYDSIRERIKTGRWIDLFGWTNHSHKGYAALFHSSQPTTPLTPQPTYSNPDPVKKAPEDTSRDTIIDDAPPAHLISSRTILILLPLTLGLNLLAIHLSFGNLIPPSLTLLATVMALLLSIMGVRALGETDLNPVSGISKLTQLIFALVVPSSNKHAITINLLAGAVSESGALQAGDMMQDLKTGHLLGASPKAQFYGQLIGSVAGAVISAAVYRLYVSVYDVPGSLFQVPTAYVWIFTARLVTGKGLPPMAWQYALGAGLIFALTTTLRIYGTGRRWHPFVPGGIAVAVGMYNTPSFTLARTIGGLVSWYWVQWRRREETPVIVLASGLILGEGVVSIVNLGLASLGVPHL